MEISKRLMRFGLKILITMVVLNDGFHYQVDTCSPNTVRLIKLHRFRWAKSAQYMRES
jgi:hypothetical protein